MIWTGILWIKSEHIALFGTPTTTNTNCFSLTIVFYEQKPWLVMTQTLQTSETSVNHTLFRLYWIQKDTGLF